MNSSESSSSDTGSSDEETESSSEEEKQRKKRRGKKSGLFARPGASRLVSDELYAHAALQDNLASVRDINNLSFNLLVAGELEIVLDKRTKDKERCTRLEVLKKLAYKHEFLSREEVINQYVNFINRVEKGKYRWGSKSDRQAFEQNLICSISIEARKSDKRKLSKSNAKFEERKKYCLDFNRGTCRFDKSHEGKINGQTYFKLHVCRKCLVDKGIESNHTEKDCSRNK